MALLFIEGFETYGSLTNSDLTLELIKKWGAAGGTFSIVAGRDGGKCVQNTATSTFYYFVSTDITDWIVGFAIKFGVGSVVDGIIFRIREFTPTATDFHLTVNTDIFGDILINAHLLGSGTPDTSTSRFMVEDIWYYFEIKLNIDNSTGSYEVKVDGVTKLSNSGVDTKNGNGTGKYLRWTNPTVVDSYFDDIYICDNTGAQNNDFLGDCTIVAINPDSDVTTEWSTPGASHYTEIDENPSDEDTSYIETGSPTAVDLWGFENVTNLFGSIYGIQVCGESTRTGDAIDLRIVSGATTSDDVGTDNTEVNDPDYVTYTRIVELDPNTSSAWTLSNLNAAQFGAILGS